MGETFNYIEVICEVGSSVSSLSQDWPFRIDGVPDIMDITEDWKSSYDAVRYYYDMLVKLDYNKMYMESQQAESKTIIKNWHSSKVSCINLKYLLENSNSYYFHMKKVLGELFKKKKEYYCINGKWTYKEGQDFIWICSETLREWHKCLRIFLEAYNLKLPIKIKNCPVRTNGRKKGKKRNIRPESDFDRKKLETASSFDGAKYLVFPVEHFFDKVSRCLFDSVNYDDFKKALQQANPNAIGNGNRVDILYFVFKMYSTNYVAPSRQEDYIKTVQEETHKLKPDFKFSTLPHKDVQEEIWDFNKKDFKKNIKYHQKMTPPKGYSEF